MEGKKLLGKALICAAMTGATVYGDHDQQNERRHITTDERSFFSEKMKAQIDANEKAYEASKKMRKTDRQKEVSDTLVLQNDLRRAVVTILEDQTADLGIKLYQKIASTIEKAGRIHFGKANTDVRVENFAFTIFPESKVVLVPSNVMRNFALRAFPEGWNATVQEVTYDRHQVPQLEAKYGIEEERAKTLAITESTTSGVNIKFYGQNFFSSNAFFSTVAHEFCHANDWENAKGPGFEARYGRLLYAISERVNAQDRFYSDYVESISSDADQKVKYDEYFAEICSAYLNHNTALTNTDKDIVKTWLDEFSPGVDHQQNFTNALVELGMNSTVQDIQLPDKETSENYKQQMMHFLDQLEAAQPESEPK